MLTTMSQEDPKPPLSKVDKIMLLAQLCATDYHDMRKSIGAEEKQLMSDAYHRSQKRLRNTLRAYLGDE